MVGNGRQLDDYDYIPTNESHAYSVQRQPGRLTSQQPNISLIYIKCVQIKRRYRYTVGWQLHLEIEERFTSCVFLSRIYVL